MFNMKANCLSLTSVIVLIPAPTTYSFSQASCVKRYQQTSRRTEQNPGVTCYGLASYLGEGCSNTVKTC